MKTWTVEEALKLRITDTNDPVTLMSRAYDWAQRSPERTQNGALVIHPDGEWSSGYNIDLWPALECYDFTVHAEEDAILKFPLPLLAFEATLVCLWASCPSCARKVVQRKIKTIWRHKNRTCEELSNDWWKGIQEADTFMQDYGVTIHELEGPIKGAPSVKIRDRSWSPEKLEWE